MGAQTFGTFLREQRIKAGLGLRQFAERIGELPSNLSSIETGKRNPWQSVEKLRTVAEQLALVDGTTDWDRFFTLARGRLSPSVEHLLDRPLIPMLLRTVDELNLSDEEIRNFIDALRKSRNGGEHDNCRTN